MHRTGGKKLGETRRPAYNAATGDSNFDARADFNGDGSVDNLDLGILANNYALNGDN